MTTNSGDAACPVVAPKSEMTAEQAHAGIARLDVDALTDMIASALGDTYHCTRVWEAWSVGTMGEDDFEPVSESDTPREIAEEVMKMAEGMAPPRDTEALIAEHMQLVDAAMRARLTAHTERQVHMARNAVEACARKLAESVPTPIDMILHCPACLQQHIDAPGPDWDNRPHKSHLCHHCGFIWRPADVPTNGVAEIKTRGKNDHVMFDGPAAVVRSLLFDRENSRKLDWDGDRP